MMVSRKTTWRQGHKPDRTEQEPHYIERFPRWLFTVLKLAFRAPPCGIGCGVAMRLRCRGCRGRLSRGLTRRKDQRVG